MTSLLQMKSRREAALGNLNNCKYSKRNEIVALEMLHLKMLHLKMLHFKMQQISSLNEMYESRYINNRQKVIMDLK